MNKIMFIPILIIIPMLGWIVYLEFDNNREYEELQVEYEELQVEYEKLRTDRDEISLQNNWYKIKVKENIALLNKEFQKYASNELKLEQALQQSNEQIREQLNESIKNQQKPLTSIVDQNVNWHVSDSKGNVYDWLMPITTYEWYVRAYEPQNMLSLKITSTGEIITVRDHTKFVQNSFRDIIDNVYDNSENDADFVWEVWYIVSQLTTYSYDIDEDPRWALETLSRGGGDCEDTAILIAEMLKSSKHTQNWKIELVYFDTDNPQDPKTVNHVAVQINDGKYNYLVESTAKDDPYAWPAGVTGWYFEV